MVNDTAERLIKLVKDRVPTVRSEGALQDVLLTVEEMRKRFGNMKASNITNTKLQQAICNALKLN